jgi:hypothetical protein
MSDASNTQGTDYEPESTLEEAFLLYRAEGLRLPPVPRELADELLTQARWQFATRPCDISDRGAFLAEAARPDTAPQVAFGHIGHGQASWYLCYRLITGTLGVFARQRYGSPYEDAALAREVVNATMAQIEELVVVADAARDARRLRPGERLLLVIDDQEKGGWQVSGDGAGWHPSEFPLSDAQNFLEG